MKVGSIDVLPVLDGHMIFAEPPGFPAKNSPEFEPHRSYISAAGEFRAELGGFLVRTGSQLVLIDAGLGPATSSDGEHRPGDDPHGVDRYLELFRGFGTPDEHLAKMRDDLQRQVVHHGNLEDSLRELGVDPSDITDVVLTHAHPDHVGWTTKDGVPFFPNARVWCHQADVDHFMGPDAPDETGFKVMLGTAPTRDRLAPAREHFEVWRADRPIAPGVNLRHLPGHTPGNAIAVISSGADRAYVLGDTFHCAMELIDPEFHVRGDIDQEGAQRSKDVVRGEIEDGSIAVASPHFPGLRFGRLFVTEGRRNWTWEGM